MHLFLSLRFPSLPPLNPPALSSCAQETEGPRHGLARPAPSPASHGAPIPGLIPCIVGPLLSQPDPASPSPPTPAAAIPRHRRAARHLVGVGKGVQLRVGARSAVTCPPPPVLFGLLLHRVLVQHKSMELRTRIVVGCYKKGGSLARISIRSSLNENPMSPPSSSQEEAPSSSEVVVKTTIEPSNVACGG